MPQTKVTVLISGNGSNLQALIDAVARAQHSPITGDHAPRLPDVSIVRVISNKKAAYGLQRAQAANIPTAYHNLVVYKKRFGPGDEAAAREAYDADLAALILKDNPGLVICAGWMHILSSKFLDPLQAADIRIINLHPALPGEFNGANAIERAWTDWQAGRITRTGVMIHNVISEVDMGAPVVVQEIPFIETDRQLESLEQRIHGIEHRIIVEGTRLAIAEMQQHPDQGEHADTRRVS